MAKKKQSYRANRQKPIPRKETIFLIVRKMSPLAKLKKKCSALTGWTSQKKSSLNIRHHFGFMAKQNGSFQEANGCKGATFSSE